MTRTAVIAGGGIAGMAAALALARTGWQVRLFEQAPALGEVGAGLQVSPNAVRALDWLGVGPAARAAGFAPEAATMRDGRSGATLFRLPLGQAAEARWRAPWLQLHRADLLGLLTDAARAAGAEIRTGIRVAGYMPRPGGVRLELTGPDGRAGHAEADIALGADGIRSMLRQRLNGEEEPDFSGQVAWRALVPADRLDRPAEPMTTVWVGPGRHVTTYPLRDRKLVNIVAVEERAEWAEEGWSHPGDPAALRAAFAGWHAEVGALLGAVEEPFLWGLFTRPEQVRWTEGRLALLGDAAHPMLPFMAQGAAQALEDAVALARLLAAEPDAAAAFARYEAERWPRATRVQAQSRANGRLFHRRTALGRLLHQGPVALATRLAPGFAAGRLDWLYGHDVTA